VAAWLACSSGPGESGSTVPSPSNLQLSIRGFNEIELRWVAPSERVDGFVVEERESGGSFEPVPGGPVDPNDSVVDVVFADSDPELTEYDFQVQAQRGNALSDPSNAVSYLRGVRTPRITSATLVDAGVVLIWSEPSAVADHASVVRSFSVDGLNYVSQWVRVLDAGVGELLDTDVIEAQYYRYSVRLLAGAVQSFPSLADVVDPVRAPLDLAATSGPGWVQLAWTNQSAVATGVTVFRDQAPVVQLPSDAASYTDTEAVLGVHVYDVGAQAGGFTGYSAPAFAAPWPDGGALQLRSNVTLAPAMPVLSVQFAVLAPDLTWCQVGAVTSPSVAVGCGPDAGVDPVVLDSNANYGGESAGFDDAGVLHVLYARGDLVSSGSIVHAAMSAGTWTTEVIGTETGNDYEGAYYHFAVGADGTLHALWAGPEVGLPDSGASERSDVYARHFATGWSNQLIPWGDTGYARLAGAPDGTGVFLLASFIPGDPLQLAEVAPSGSVTFSPIPSGDHTFDQFIALFEVQVSDTGDVWVEYQRDEPGGQADLMELVRRNGTWGQPGVIGQAAGSSGGRFCMSRDGSRRAVMAYTSGTDSVLYVSTNQGWVRAINEDLRGTAAFDGNGRLHVLVGSWSLYLRGGGTAFGLLEYSE
jgi:hypothetical protein